MKPMILPEKVLQKLKKYKYPLMVLGVGLFLLLIPTGSGEKETTVSSAPAEEIFSLKEQENALEELLSSVSGAGKVQVMLSLESGTESVIARDREEATQTGEEEERDMKSTAVILSKDSGEETAVLQYLYPQYRGAVVVAEGGDRDSVKLELTKAVSSLTGLSTDKITVVKMKQ